MPRRYESLNLVMLSSTLGAMVLNLLRCVYPGYAFRLVERTDRHGVRLSAALLGTFDVEIASDGPRLMAERHLTPVMSTANGAYLMALRNLCEDTRYLAVMGPEHSGEIHYRLGLQRAALALGAIDVSVTPLSYPECWVMNVVARSEAEAKRIANAACAAAGCAINWVEHKLIDVSPAGPDGMYVSFNNLIVKAYGRPSARAETGVAAG